MYSIGNMYGNRREINHNYVFAQYLQIHNVISQLELLFSLLTISASQVEKYHLVLPLGARGSEVSVRRVGYCSLIVSTPNFAGW